MFRRMDDAGAHGVVLTPGVRLGYLSAVYTGAVPYVGNGYWTPEPDARRTQMQEFYDGGVMGPWFDAVDLVMVDRTRIPGAVAALQWPAVLANSDFVLLQRPPHDGNP